MNGTANPLLLTGGAYSIATEVFPDRFSSDDLTNGYLVTLAVSIHYFRVLTPTKVPYLQPQTNQLGFFYFPGYTEEAFQHTRDTEQPVSQAVLFTQSSIMQTAQSFQGPVHVVTFDPLIRFFKSDKCDR